MKVVSLVERPDLDERWDETVRPAWPEFMLHDTVCNELWGELFEGTFAPFQFFLFEEESDAVLAPGALVPVHVDRERDQCVYVEPNIWMRHRLA
ncbi:MAG TPA: hypothetical protein VF984_04875 [Actinomycetota bacterium]